MEPYCKFRPTQLDSHIPLEDREDWLVAPLIVTRDTEDKRVLNNWDRTRGKLKILDPKGEAHEVHRFRHWGPGWYEIILVKPGTPCEKHLKKRKVKV